MTSRVVHFEIPIDEPERAKTFYRQVFGWNIAQWDAMEYWTVSAGEEKGPGSDGALAPRKDAPEGVVVYVNVNNIDQAMERIRQAGGTLMTEKMPVPTLGWSAHFRDSEGNMVGLFQEDSTVPMPA
jgi:predicted enzyme related to lactoylglutathione lyase